MQDGFVAALDFGHSGVKRAVVQRVNGVVSRFEVLPTIPVPSPIDDVHVLVTEAVIDLVRDAPAVDQVSMSLASYVIDGRILASDRSPYAQLGADLPEVLADRCGAVRVLLSHDGTSAARAVPPTPSTAVIVMGSALGSGFSPKC